MTFLNDKEFNIYAQPYAQKPRSHATSKCLLGDYLSRIEVTFFITHPISQP